MELKKNFKLSYPEGQQSVELPVRLDDVDPQRLFPQDVHLWN